MAGFAAAGTDMSGGCGHDEGLEIAFSSAFAKRSLEAVPAMVVSS
jgi:hypothetical protein